MSKLIISADSHIFDYTQYNDDLNFRLNQFIKLAHRLNEIGKEQKSKKLALLGDTIHKPILTPKVAHVASEYFEILSEYYEDIYYILGQHCTDSKSESFLESDSLVPILGKHTKAKYMNKKIISLGGRNIAFCNWEMNTDWSFIEGKNVDVFLGHLTLDERFGQSYVNKDYKIGFFGDIHKKYSIGKDHTVNVPIPHYISDEQNGSVISLDLSDLSWERIDTESENFKYLKIYYEDEAPKGYDPAWVKIVKKPEITETVSKIYKSLDVSTLINKLIKENGLEAVHSEVMSEIDDNIVETNYDFKLENIKIKNFRSISDLDYNFIKSGITLITGLNGAGKSTLMRAVQFIFSPPRTVKALVKTGCSTMYVRLKLSYFGSVYDIERGLEKGSTYLKVFKTGKDGIEEELKSTSLAGLTKILEDQLPFISMFDLFYRTQESAHILEDYNYSDRISMISKILNINIVEIIHKVAKGNLNKINKDFDSLSSKLEALLPVLETLDDTRFCDDIEDNIEDLIKSNSNLLKIKNECERKESLVKNLNDCENQCESIKTNIESLSKHTVMKGETFELETLLSKEADQLEVIKNLENDLSNKKKKLTLINNEIFKNDSKISEKQDLIKKLESQINNVSEYCPTCSQRLAQSDINDVKSKFSLEIKDIEIEIKTCTAIQPSLIFDYNNIESEIKKIGEIISKEKLTLSEVVELINGYKRDKKLYDEIESLKLKLAELNLKRDRLVIESNGINVNFVKEQIAEISETISQNEMTIFELKTIISNKKKFDEVKEKINDIEDDICIFKTQISNYESYVRLFSDKGSIIQSVFSEISNIMSTDTIKISTVKTLASGDTRIDFDIHYKVGNVFIPYSELSGGQKTLIDVFFLCKLYAISGRVGLLMMDETLSDLDGNNLEETIKNLTNSDISNIIITSHLDSFNYFNSRILVKLKGNDSKYIVD